MLWWTLMVAGMWSRWAHLHLPPVLASMPASYKPFSVQLYAVPTALMPSRAITPPFDGLDAVERLLSSSITTIIWQCKDLQHLSAHGTQVGAATENSIVVAAGPAPS